MIIASSTALKQLGSWCFSQKTLGDVKALL